MRGMQAKAQDKKGNREESPMVIRRAVPIALALMLAGCSSSAPPSAYSQPTPTQAVQASQDAVDTPEWMRQRDYRNGGPLPPMEEGRKVNEQSCTEGIVLDAGNLKCK
jgi:hypothetical protein